MKNIIYYYQTLCGLDDILNEKNPKVSHIYVSSIHFGKNLDGTPYIHLNDHVPDDKIFNNKDIFQECPTPLLIGT